MEYVLLALCTVTAAIQSPFKKLYQRKTSKGAFLFSAMISLVAALFFGVGALVGGTPAYSLAVLPYSVGFAACYGVCAVSSVLALGCGSLALTSLISGYSLVLPTVFGLILWEDPLYLTQVIGFVILVVSLYFANKRTAPVAKAGEAENESNTDKFSVKWLIYVSLMFVSNGGCAIMQQLQQNKFSEQNGYTYDFKNEFMFVALLIVVALFVGIGLWRERRDLKTVARLGALPAVLTGLCNGLTNLLVMVVVGVSISAAVFFPVISAGGLVISYVISVLFFKERFSNVQKLGILLGLVSVILLNLSFVQLL